MKSSLQPCAALTALLALLAVTPPGTSRAAADDAPRWTVARTVQLKGLEVSVSEPVMVARSKGYLWFPTLARRADGRLLAVMSNKADVHTDEQTAAVAYSRDGGLTWTPAEPVPVYSECPVALPDGLLLLPNYLFPQTGGAIGGSYLFWPNARDDLEHVKEPLTVAGWPADKPLDRLGERFGRPDLKLAGFVFNGQTLRLEGEGGRPRYLATLYGYFKGDQRYSLVTAESEDGRRWRYVSTVAGADCKLEGAEGPCEAALARLKDGRLMCVFRLASNVPYGRCYSDDGGRTWTEPENIAARSVQPSLVVMPDGLVALSGGRPGVYMWFDTAGKGEDWQAVQLLADDVRTSAYTEIVALDDSTLLCVYDRVPHGWDAIPETSPEFNSVWVVRLTVRRVP